MPVVDDNGSGSGTAGIHGSVGMIGVTVQVQGNKKQEGAEEASEEEQQDVNEKEVAARRRRCVRRAWIACGITTLVVVALLLVIFLFVLDGAYPLSAELRDVNQSHVMIVHHFPSGYHEGDVASPSIAEVPWDSNILLASNDRVAKPVSEVHRSEDGGETWALVSEVPDTYWCTLFFYRDALYMLGTTKEYGDMMIRRSDDLGETWTDPFDGNSTGLLTSGEHWHRAPTPVVHYNGRLWHAMESFKEGGKWPQDFKSVVWSIPEDADLLNASAWRTSNHLAYPSSLHSTGMGWLEGNAVVGPHGEMLVIARIHSLIGGDAAVLQVEHEAGRDAEELVFKHSMPFPGAAKKFLIRYDNVTERYWTLTNVLIVRLTVPVGKFLVLRLNGRLLFRHPAMERRNALAVMSSHDLVSWDLHKILQYNSTMRHGFQYPDFIISGDDLLYVVRVAHTHEGYTPSKPLAGNMMTFHRIPDFRKQMLRYTEGAMAFDVDAQPDPQAVFFHTDMASNGRSEADVKAELQAQEAKASAIETCRAC